MKAWLRRNPLFVVLVLLPTASALVYFGLIASDVYVSESRFLVRSPQHSAQPEGLVGMLIQGSGVAHSQDDTYAVRDYIISRDALAELQKTLDVQRLYSPAGVSIFDRFHGFPWNGTFEDLYRFYGKHVLVEYDPISAISTLTVRGFAADDAYRINSALLDLSERLVNSLNDRSRRDTIQNAQDEVTIASNKVKDASIAMLTFRSAQSVFQPDKQAAIQLEGVAKIEQELVATEAEIAQIRKLSPDNPAIGGLVSRAESLRSAIATEGAKVTGDRGSFSSRAPSFERLALDVEFADKQLGIALAELETARASAAQKQLYLERLVQPSLPDKSLEPKRLVSIIAVFIMSLVIWAVASVLVASVREHAD
jgi:capsular polysaccharide transport system permease protein